MFSASSAVDFKIRDAFGQEVRVDMTKPKSWVVRYHDTQDVFNIARDSGKGGMVCGGTGKGQFSKQELRPNAEAFYKLFSDGKDNWDEVTDMAGAGMQVNRCRRAKESSIRIGDAIAVIGTLRSGDEGMFLEGGDDCVITNSPVIAKQLNTVPTFQLPAVSATGVQMRKIES